MSVRSLFAMLLALVGPVPALGASWSAPEIAGLMADEALSETSGMVPARHHPGHFWVHNDSGNAAELHLMSERGERVATVPVDGVRNVDWEDLAKFTLDGRSYLVIADTGDNGGIRRTLRLIVLEEPRALSPGLRLSPAWTVAFRWPDGPRDCEAIAVDVRAGEVLLISKKRVPPELFRVALKPATSTPQVAERIGLLEGIAQPSEADLARNPIYGRYRAQVTGADLSPDGRTLAVLNYQSVLLYRRPGARAPWASALAAPTTLPFTWMPQAEAIAFGADGLSLWVAGEQRPSPLIRFRASPP